MWRGWPYSDCISAATLVLPEAAAIAAREMRALHTYAALRERSPHVELFAWLRQPVSRQAGARNELPPSPPQPSQRYHPY